MNADARNQISTLYAELLESLSEQYEEQIAAMAASRGLEYDGRLMVIGRAGNGGDLNYSPKDLQDRAKRDSAVEKIVETLALCKGGACPLAWVREHWSGSHQYNTARSAFWQVNRAVANNLIGLNDDPNWASHLVWSNLCKISPASGRNPGAKLSRLQLHASQRILDAEIKLFAPKFVLFQTGIHWFDWFFSPLPSPLPIDFETKAEGQSVRRYIVNNSVWVVVPHPERKKRQPIIDAATAAFDWKPA